MSSLDDIIRGKLDGRRADAAPDWDALRDRLDADADADAPGRQFDELLAGRLRDARADAPAHASWTQLSHRMDTLWPLRRRLVRYRVLEIAAAVALVLTFAPLLRDNPVFSGSDGEYVEAAAALPTTEAAPEHATAQGYTDNPLRTPTALVQSATTYVADLFGAAGQPVVSPASEVPAAVALRPGRLQSPIASLVGDRRVAAGSPATPLAQTPAATVASYAQLLQDLSVRPLEVDVHLPSVIAPAAASTNSRWGLGPYVGVQSWNVRTPRDFAFAQTARTHRINTAQIGLGATYRLGDRFALGFGVSHTRLSYDPDFPTVVQPNAYVFGPIRLARAETFTNISLDLAQVPLELRFGVLDPARRFQVSLKAGVAANFALNTEYDLRTTIAEADEIVAMARPPAPASGLAPAAPPAIVREELPSAAKPFVEGVFDAGLTRSNTYVSGRLGVEAAYALNGRIDVFSGVDYSHFFDLTDGFGPNQDAFNAVGITLGSRINL